MLPLSKVNSHVPSVFYEIIFCHAITDFNVEMRARVATDCLAGKR